MGGGYPARRRHTRDHGLAERPVRGGHGQRVRRSDIALGRPNTDPTQSVPVGNGTLGAALWAAGGFTA